MITPLPANIIFGGIFYARNLDGCKSLKTIANEYGVSEKTIWKISKNKYII